jgi:hypothetical protein
LSAPVSLSSTAKALTPPGVPVLHMYSRVPSAESVKCAGSRVSMISLGADSAPVSGIELRDGDAHLLGILGGDVDQGFLGHGGGTKAGEESGKQGDTERRGSHRLPRGRRAGSMPQGK